MSAVMRWGVAALLGVALAVALTLATLRLTDQHVGLAGAPQDAGRGLVPTATTTTKNTRTVTVTVPPTRTSAPPSDDDGGGSEGGGSDD